MGGAAVRGLMYLSGLEQLKAVEAGNKPICSISPHEVRSHNTTLSYVEVYLISRAYVNGQYYSAPFTDRIYYSEGKRENAMKVKELWERSHGLSDNDHRFLGKSFGYEEDEIEAFVKKVGKV